MTTMLVLAACGGDAQDEAAVTVGGAFSLVEHTGARVTEKDFEGRPFLVYFGFANCTDACPLTMAQLGLAMEILGPDAEGVQTLFISVDPERDTPEVLALYVGNNGFPENLRGLTGTPEEIRAVADAYRAHYKRLESPETVAGYNMQHPNVLYLMDADGRFVDLIHPSTPQDIADGLRQHLDGARG